MALLLAMASPDELSIRAITAVAGNVRPVCGQSVADWYGALKRPANVHWVSAGDAQDLFDLLSARLARLQ